jgi:release factor glutamine methyltransferase
MKALETLQEISKKLSPLNIENPDREAEILLHQGLRMDLVEMYRDNPEISNEQKTLIEKMITRRAGHEPLQYITGHTDFMELEISVGQGVLIPRPETEIMAELAINILRSTSDVRRLTVLDLCTGSGCLALALAKNFPDSKVCGIDISEAALGYALKNAEANEIGNVEFMKGHLFDPLAQNSKFDLIISNPPYIRKDDIRDLQPEIREWEPLNALDGGEDGLDFYREIIPSARVYLKENAALMFEVGFDEADSVAGIFRNAGYHEIQITKDYSGIKRIVHAQWTK